MIRMRVVRLKFKDGTKSIPSNMWSLRSNLGFDARGNVCLKEPVSSMPPEDTP